MWIDLVFGQGEQIHEDSEYLAQEPTWEISFEVNNEEIIKQGLILENSNKDYDEAILYYCEHNPTFNNRLEILEKMIINY